MRAIALIKVKRERQRFCDASTVLQGDFVTMAALRCQSKLDCRATPNAILQCYAAISSASLAMLGAFATSYQTRLAARRKVHDVLGAALRMAFLQSSPRRAAPRRASSAMRAAVRMAMAVMVNDGFTPPVVGKIEPSQTNRLGMSLVLIR